ncbi:MAG: hypothetical protein RR140_01625 [Clostridia bacterium]
MKKQFNFIKNAKWFLIAPVVLLLAGIVIFSIFGFNVKSTILGSQIVLNRAMLAILLVFVAVFVYLLFRFGISSAMTSVLFFIINILVTLAVLAICRAPVGATLITSMMFVVAYSLFMNILLFSNIKQNKNNPDNIGLSNFEIAEMASESCFSHITDFGMISLYSFAIAIFISTPQIRMFFLPIIIGILITTYTSIFLIPTVWAFGNLKNKIKQKKVQKQD